jgi:AraC-like DNA-binding protein
MTQLVRSDSLTGYDKVVEELAGNPEDLLALFDLTLDQIHTQGFMLPYRSFVGLLEHTAEALNCPDFGIRCAGRQDFSVLGPIALAAQQSINLAQALERVSSYLHVYTPALGLSVGIIPGKNTIMVTLDILLNPLPACSQAVELTMALSAKIIHMISGGRSKPLRVLLPHSCINKPSVYRKAFPCEVLFQQGVSSFEIHVRDLNLPLITEQSELGEMAYAYLQSHFTVKRQSTADKVKALIKPLIMAGHCTNDVVAKALGFEVRQLHRLLETEGQNFRAIKDGVLKELAMHYLQEPTLRLGQVARLLGYAEQSAFSRSCQRWFNMGPRDYRKSFLTDAVLELAD